MYCSLWTSRIRDRCDAILESVLYMVFGYVPILYPNDNEMVLCGSILGDLR